MLSDYLDNIKMYTNRYKIVQIKIKKDFIKLETVLKELEQDDSVILVLLESALLFLLLLKLLEVEEGHQLQQ